MIGYVVVGTNDWPRALAFYDALMAEMGAKRLMDFEGFVVWGRDRDTPGLALAVPHNRQPATVGNGMMVAFRVQTPEQVDRLYRKALALGGTDEGPPGDRGYNYYGAYFRDLDGNKLNFHCWT